MGRMNIMKGCVHNLCVHNLISIKLYNSKLYLPKGSKSGSGFKTCLDLDLLFKTKCYL